VTGRTGGGSGLGPARYDSGGVLRQVAGQSPNESVAAGGGGGSGDSAGDEEGGWGRGRACRVLSSAFCDVSSPNRTCDS